MTVVERDLPDRRRPPSCSALDPRARRRASSRRAPRDEAAAGSRARCSASSGKAGLLGLPYPEEYGGGGQPYEVYLQVLEELAGGWAAVADGRQRAHAGLLPARRVRHRRAAASGGCPTCSAASCSAPTACPSRSPAPTPAALTTRAVRDGDDYVVNGTKAWITHGGVADFYNVFCRTSDDGAARHLLPAGSTRARPGSRPQPPERKMGLRPRPPPRSSSTAPGSPADRLIGAEGDGFAHRAGARSTAAGSASPRARSAWPRRHSTPPSATPRSASSSASRIVDFQGVGFLLADMATQVEAARALYLAAARRRDAGRPFGTQAAMAKLFCTDTAMRVTTDAVQVLGGYGYVEDFPVERYMREAKVAADRRGHQPDPAHGHRPPPRLRHAESQPLGTL